MTFYPALLAAIGVLFAQSAPSLTTAAPEIVTTAWLQEHLNDPAVRVIFTGDRAVYDRAHIPGARYIGHEAAMVMNSNQGLPEPATLASALAQAGAADNMRMVLYGDSPMTTGWLFMAFASIGHDADVSMLEAGIDAWRAEGRPSRRRFPSLAPGRCPSDRPVMSSSTPPGSRRALIRLTCACLMCGPPVNGMPATFPGRRWSSGRISSPT